jgi:hypothetical protein
MSKKIQYRHATVKDAKRFAKKVLKSKSSAEAFIKTISRVG